MSDKWRGGVVGFFAGVTFGYLILAYSMDIPVGRFGTDLLVGLVACCVALVARPLLPRR